MQYTDRSARRAPASAGGYTLIELMIIVVVIGVILMLALPTYVSYKTRARVAEALTDLAKVETAAKLEGKQLTMILTPK